LLASCPGATEFLLLRRHFFLVGALTTLILLVVAGGLKIAFKGKGADAGGGVAASSGAPGGKSGARRGGAGGGAPQISIAVVQSRTFVDTIEALGVAKGRQSVTLTAATTQLVERVLFSDGQSVPRGAVLVELKSNEQDAGLAQAQARMVEAERAYQRYKSLNEKGYASKAALDQYEAAWLSAKADVAAARAQQGDRTIRAPFAGVVGLSDIAPGALVNPGAPIVTLDDLSTVRVDFQVPERYVGSLREGQEISAAVDAYPGEPIRGRIARLDTRVDERTRAITARAEFPNPGRKIRSGMMMRVSIARGERRGLAAPESAVSVQGDAAFIYAVLAHGQGNVADQRPVLTGARQDGFVELREGAQPGLKIVADGLNKVQAGQPVRIARKGGAAGSSGQKRPAI